MEEQFGNRLMNLRKVNGLSQEDLGSLVNVSRQTVSKWELNQTTPEMDKLASISDVFHISLDELLGKEKYVHENSNYEELNKKLDRIIYSKKLLHYEYKSNRMVGKLPLIHVNLGYGMYRAKGFISIGMISTGIISVGFLSSGIISIGVLAFGIFALAMMAAGVVAAGSISLGILALGAISIGYLSVGALAIGVYSIGADAIASRIALGDVATGHIAIGKTTVKGSIEFLTKNHVSADEIRSAILREYPNTWDWIVKIFSSLR